MKYLILALTLIFTTTYAQSSDDQFLKQHKFWQSHRIEKTQWLWQIFRELREQKIVTGSLKSIEKEILKRNPHITNKNKIPAGTHILVPMTGPHFIPRHIASKENKNGTQNTYNFYYKPTIYNNVTKKPPQKNVIAAQDEDKESSRPSSWLIEGLFSYSQLTTTVISNNDKIKLTSNENFGLTLGYRLPIYEESHLEFYLQGHYENYDKPTNISNLKKTKTLLKTAGASLSLPLSKNWNFKINLGLKENLYTTTNTSDIVLEPILQPHLGLFLSYRLIESSFYDTYIATKASYFHKGLNDKYNSKNGFSIEGTVENTFTIKDQNLFLRLWYEHKNLNTTIHKTTTEYLGFTFGWNS